MLEPCSAQNSMPRKSIELASGMRDDGHCTNNAGACIHGQTDLFRLDRLLLVNLPRGKVSSKENLFFAADPKDTTHPHMGGCWLLATAGVFAT
jgi:hypothetical protein